MISALLGMLASCASSVASSHRRYEGDIQSNDNLHEVDSLIWEQHELGDVSTICTIHVVLKIRKRCQTACGFTSHTYIQDLL